MRRLVITQSITNSDSETFRKYLRDVNVFPILNDKEELMYAKRSKDGDKKATEILINCNLRFVISVAKQYISKDSKLEDLVNEGNIGLIKAVELYEPTSGNRLLSYAVWWIRNQILEYKSNQSKLVRVPIHKLSDMTKINNMYFKLQNTLSREPSPSEIADKFKGLFSISEIKDCIKLVNGGSNSIDVETQSGEIYSDTLESNLPSADDLILSSDKDKIFNDMLSILTEKELYIITRLFGLDGWVSVPLEVLGDELGLSREGIRQIREKVLKKLRKKIKISDYED